MNKKYLLYIANFTIAVLGGILFWIRDVWWLWLIFLPTVFFVIKFKPESKQEKEELENFSNKQNILNKKPPMNKAYSMEVRGKSP